MIKCPNCNKELEDDVRFCDECGAAIPVPAPQEAPKEEPQAQGVFCPTCGKMLPVGSVFCDNCGTNLSETANVDVSQIHTEKTKGAVKPGFIVAIAGAALALVVVIVIGIFAVSNLGSKSDVDYALYLKDEQLFHSDLSKKEPMQISEDMFDDMDLSNSDLRGYSSDISRRIQISDDGKYMFYTDKIESLGNVTIYYKNRAKLDEKATKIDSDISSYSIDAKGTFMVYLKDGDTLYSYNVKKGEKNKIASDVVGYSVSDDCKLVYYVDDEGTLYCWTMDKDKEKLDSDIYHVESISSDYKTIYYLKDENLYKRTDKEEKDKIASDVLNVISIYDDGSMYYLKSADEEVSMDMFVSDDKEEEDKNMEEPDYPSRYDYSSNAEYNAALKKYDKEYEEYNAKRNRDYMRESMEEYEADVDVRTLCYFDGKEEHVITEGYTDEYVYSGSKPAIIYTTINLEEIEKVKLSKIMEEGMSMYDVIEEAIDESSACYYLSENKEPVQIDAEDIYGFRMNGDGDKILYLAEYDREKREGELYQVTVKGGELSSAESIDSDVYRYGYGFIDDSYMYYKDVDSEDNSGDLYVDGENIAYDVSVSGYRMKDGILYYITDFDSEDGSGTLFAYEKDKPVKIADDVFNMSCLEEGELLLLTNYSTKKYRGELHLYENGKLRKLDDDVVCILSSNYTSSTIYNYYGPEEEE